MTTFAKEKGTRPPRACSVVKVRVPPATAMTLMSFARSIMPADLIRDGVEHNPHVTVCFGVPGDDPTAVAAAVRGFGPFGVTLGLLGFFSLARHETLYADAESPHLRKLNAVLAPLAAPDRFLFRPHVTLARLRPGRAGAYRGSDRFKGFRFVVDSVVFSDRHRVETVIPLA